MRSRKKWRERGPHGRKRALDEATRRRQDDARRFRAVRDRSLDLLHPPTARAVDALSGCVDAVGCARPAQAAIA